MTLYEKIQVLCKKEGFEISNLGEHIPGLTVTKGSISKWKSGSVPRASTLKSIAEHFGVPVAYFTENHGDTIDRQNMRTGDGSLYEPKVLRMNRIKELRNNMNLNKAETARQLEIPYTTYVSYEKGEREPNSEMLIKLAKFFNVSVDYLIGRITAYPEPDMNDFDTLAEMGKRIKSARENLQMSQEILANLVGYKSRTSINKIELGKTDMPQSTVKKIADALGVTPAYIIGYAPTAYPEPDITDDIVVFPVFGSIAAGYDELAIEDWSGDTVFLPAQYLKGRTKSDYFVLEVKGDSMYPLYIEGDKVLILKQSTVNSSGDVAAVLYDDNCSTLKKVELIKNGIRLVPINAMYPPKEVTGADTEHCRIIGVPKLLIRDIE